MKLLLSVCVFAQLLTAASLQWQSAPVPHGHTSNVQPNKSNPDRESHTEVRFNNNTEYQTQSCNFRHTPNAAIKGYNTRTLAGHTVDECKAACCASTGCKSFDYYVKKAVCYLSDKSQCDYGLSSNYMGFPYDHYSKEPVAKAPPPPPAVSSAGGRLCPSECANVPSFCATTACGGCGACAPCYVTCKPRVWSTGPGIGCADGTAESVFAKDGGGPSVVGCDGQWDNGLGGAEELCGEGFRICKSSSEAHSLGLSVLLCSTRPQPGKFYMSRQSSEGGGACSTDGEGMDSVWGCGRDGNGREFQNNSCGPLNKVWGTTFDGSSPVPTFESDHSSHELKHVTHHGCDGGVLCCKTSGVLAAQAKQAAKKVAVLVAAERAAAVAHEKAQAETDALAAATHEICDLAATHSSHVSSAMHSSHGTLCEMLSEAEAESEEAAKHLGQIRQKTQNASAEALSS